MSDHTRYDRDPEALAWARTKVQHEIDRCRKFAESADAAGNFEQFEMWRRLANRMQRTFIGGESCVMGHFDERLPDLARAVDNALAAPVDRAVRRDHSLCGAPHHQHPQTLCTEPAGHYRRDVDPHAGPLILDGVECGGAAWDEPEEQH